MRVLALSFFFLIALYCGAQVQIVNPFAGGSGPLDGIGTKSLLSSPWQIVIKDTVIYISDRGYNALRKMNLKTKKVTTLLTNQLDIAGLALSPTGDTLYFATRNPQNLSFVVNLYKPALNQAIPIDSIPDSDLDALICDKKGRLYMAGAGNRIIQRNLDGTKKVIAGKLNEIGVIDGVDSLARFNRISSLAFSNTEDTLYISDRFNSRLRRLIRSTRIVSTMPGVPVFAHRQLAFNKRKDTLYIANSGGHTIVRYSLKSNSGIAWCGLNSTAGYVDANLTSARFNFPMGIARSDSGWVVCDNSNKRIRLISFAGRVKTIAGIGLLGDGIGENSRFLEPYDVVKHPKKDTIYITDRGNNAIRQIDLKTQTLKTIVGNGNSGNVNGIGDNVVLSRPFNMAISETGDSLYFTEPFSNRIKLLLTKTREVKLLAGTDASGYLDSTIGRFARFNQPQDIALKGNILYVADARNQRIRAVDVLTSRVTTFAGSGSTITGGFKDSTLLFSRFNRPFSLEWVGNKLFIGEDAGLRIRVLYPDSGKVKVWAGSGNIGLTDGLGTAARFFSIQKLSYDPAQNNLFVSGASNLGQLRTVGVTSPTVKTFLNSNGFQNGLLNQAKFLGPTGIFTDVPKKRYLVMDLGNNRIRSINWFPNNAPKAKIDTLLNLIEDQGVVTRPGFGQNLNAGLGVGDTLQKFNFFIGSAVSILNSSLDTLGKLTIETAPDSNGVYTIRILQKDNGGTALGGVDTSVHFVKLRITPVNDPPRFDSLRNDTARYDQPRERIGFLTNFLPGPWDERNQTLTYSITNDQPGLFTTQPFIENGALKFTPNGSMGLVNLKLKAKDNGGTELNGVDSTIKTFTILLVDPTSVEDLKQSKWLAYPNPVRTELRFLNLPQNLSQISWFNVQGQKVAVSEIEWNGNQPGIKVPPKLKGIYQLRTDVGNNNRNLRIVVQ